MFIGVRHGQRADQSNNQQEMARIELSSDPHLTKRGEQQASLTGEHIVYILKTHLVERPYLQSLNVTIVASPFLRTIMTAQCLLQPLRTLHPYLTLNLDYQFSEYLGDYDNFPEDIINGYLMVQSDLEKVKKDYLQTDQVSLHDIQEPNVDNYPRIHESVQLLENRMKRGVKELEEKYLMEKDGSARKDQVVIVVSHAGCIDMIGRTQGVYTDTMIGYCGLLAWTYQEHNMSKPSVFIKSSTDHLKVKNLEGNGPQQNNY